MEKCIICGREFEVVFNRPVRDLIWSRMEERLRKGLRPLYKQICQLCRLKFATEIIETSTRAYENAGKKKEEE